MKTIKLILILISVIICCSCEKESHWLCHTYGGGYETTHITLEFSDDRTECEVTETSMVLAEYPYGSTHKTYKAYLNEEEKSFMLNEGDYDSRILYWGQITADGKCTLNFYRGEELTTVELVAHKLE